MKNPKKECACENCTCKNVEADLDYLHEEILWLAEDVMVLDEENEDIIDWANTCVDLFWFLFIWNVILTALIVLLHYNVL